VIPNPTTEASFAPTLVDLLRQRAAYRPHDRAFTFLVDGEHEELNITYAELDRKARAVGAWLMDRGMTGKRALLLYPSGLDFITAFMGCLYGGAIAVPAYPPRKNRSVERIEAIAADADAAVALTTRDVLDRFESLGTTAPSLDHLTWQVDSELDLTWGDRWERPDIDGDTLAFLQYTSGSTGTPKGVMLSHENLLHNSLRIMQAFEITRSQSGVFWLPSFHDMGLIGGILVPLYGGKFNVLMSPVAFLQKPLRWPRSAAAPTSLTSSACERPRRSSGRRSTSRAGRWPSTAPSRCEPRRSTPSARPSPSAASAARLSIPATGWPRAR
jgi:acyl-CoA synthetase (AMP-forming)/AMP-acid ligase II